MKKAKCYILAMLLLPSCTTTEQWNNWKDRDSVIKCLEKAGNEGKTYYSQFDYYEPRKDNALNSTDKDRYGRHLQIYGLDFYYASGTWYKKNSIENARRNMLSIVKEMWQKYRAIPSFSWHLENPYVPSDFKESMGCRYRYSKQLAGYPEEHRYVIREILNGTGGKCGLGNISRKDNEKTYNTPREWFEERCIEVAKLINEMKDYKGRSIPILFRLWHECEDNWMWWGSDCVTPDEYKAFFRLTVNTIRKHCPSAQILWGYGPDSYWKTKEEFMLRYPGDDMVDVIGYDDYRFGKSDSDFQDGVKRSRIVTLAAKERGKIAALFETNNNEVNQSFFFAKRLDSLLNDSLVNFPIVQIWKTTYGKTDEAIKDRNIFLGLKKIITAEGTKEK